MPKLNVPKNRKNTRLNFDQFKDQVKSGLSLRQIISTGVSKHQVAFFSSMSKNKVGITKDQFSGY